eukprot:m.354549 g.354549  ORF g.354549 m.354549 type:complete len:53 (-) comp17048_c0_seq1:1775-1933(-)
MSTAKNEAEGVYSKMHQSLEPPVSAEQTGSHQSKGEHLTASVQVMLTLVHFA